MDFEYPNINNIDTQFLIFTKMQESHIKQMAEIEKECFELDAWSFLTLKNELYDENKHYLIAEYNNLVIGYGGYAQILDEAHIMNIAVRSQFRNKGIGSIILDKIISDAKKRGIGALTLEVMESNNAAIRLYEKKGFECLGIRKNYYRNKHNALIYWKVF